MQLGTSHIDLQGEQAPGLRLLRDFDHVDDATLAPPVRDFYELLHTMRQAVRRKEPDWATFPELVEYADVCFWAIRKLEYSFAASAVASAERDLGASLRVLDVGCGVVPLCNWMSRRGHVVTALDPSRATIEFLRANDLNALYGSQVEFQIGRAEQLAYPDETFDLVTCVSVLEHIPPGNDRLALAEVARVLKPGGRLILTFDVAPTRDLQDGETPWPDELRRFAEPFTPTVARRLLSWLEGYYAVSPEHLPPQLDALTWDDVHAFWEAAQRADGRAEPVRNYLALAGALERRRRYRPVAQSDLVAAYLEGQTASQERLAFFEYHANARLQLVNDLREVSAAAEEKEQVIDTLKTASEERLQIIQQLEGQLHMDTGAARLASVEAAVTRHSELLGELTARLIEAEASRQAQVHALEGIQERVGELIRTHQQLNDQLATVMVAPELERAKQDAELVAEARLRIIEEQQRTIERYRLMRPRDFLARWTAPRIGQLYQYAPRPMQLPTWYTRTRRPLNPPLISIVTPSYNQGGFIERTLTSVLEQKYPRLEYIVQDAGSSDQTAEVLRRYEPLLTHVTSAADGGLADGINRGFAHATGEIMAYLNSDDLLLPGALNYVGTYFEEHPDVDVVYGHRIIVDEYDAEIGRWVLPPHDDQMLSWADYVPQETLFWRRSIWERTGGYIDETFRFAVDWELLIRFRDAGARMVRLPRFLGAFRVHPHQKTSLQMQDIGLQEMDRLREYCHGRAVTASEIDTALAPYLRRHFVYHKLYRLGIAKY